MLNCPFLARMIWPNLEAFRPLPPLRKEPDDFREAPASVQLLWTAPIRRAARSIRPRLGRFVAAPKATGHDTHGEPDDPHMSKTLISDEWDDPAADRPCSRGKSATRTTAPISRRAPRPTRPAEFGADDDPSLGRRCNPKNSPSMTAEPGPNESGTDHTVIRTSGMKAAQQPRCLSDELPQEALKTMQTMWSGAFEGKRRPG